MLMMMMMATATSAAIAIDPTIISGFAIFSVNVNISPILVRKWHNLQKLRIENLEKSMWNTSEGK